MVGSLLYFVIAAEWNDCIDWKVDQSDEMIRNPCRTRQVEADTLKLTL